MPSASIAGERHHARPLRREVHRLGAEREVERIDVLHEVADAAEPAQQAARRSRTRAHAPARELVHQRDRVRPGQVVAADDVAARRRAAGATSAAISAARSRTSTTSKPRRGVDHQLAQERAHGVVALGEARGRRGRRRRADTRCGSAPPRPGAGARRLAVGLRARVGAARGGDRRALVDRAPGREQRAEARHVDDRADAALGARRRPRARPRAGWCR